MKITRDVVSDLWPVYEAGEASADTRAVVEEFLAGDPEFAGTLRSAGTVRLPALQRSAATAAETQALRRTRDLIAGRGWLRGVRLFALAMTALALIRLIQAPAASPKRYVGEGVTAILAWAFYSLALMHQRRKALKG